MKISLEWLNQYVDLRGIAPKDIARELTMKTAEVEELALVERRLDQVRVGQVLSVQPVAGSDKLSVVRVSLGETTAQTVCGAPNLRPA